MKGLNKYHKPIAEKVLDMTNEELLEEYLYWYSGDGEDGYCSDSCAMLQRILRAELDTRLMNIGFLLPF